MALLFDPGPPADAASLGTIDGFHPAVAEWFRRRFPDGPTPPQSQAWPLIAARQDTLVAAPTGSGKTLAGFLVAIDALYRAHQAGEPVADVTRVVYVSPLRALAADIAENLEQPLAEIAEVAAELGLSPAPIRVGVRTGDTTAAERARMVRRPPSFVVTTPESLYLLVTSASGRETLRSVETLIVDEIHAVAGDKRGAHLALTVERLEALCDRRPVRIGLSATVRPIETVGRLLVGDRALPSVVDVGHRRDMDLAVELPEGEMEAVASAEQMGDILDRIAELVRHHRTTLVFVNTRRLAERFAHQLGERLGDEVVAAHHGSLSKDRRHRVEQRLRAGELRALVATASLELGIDIGPVELVCQIGSPRSIATFLQRVGRSNHSRSGVPKGRLYPLTRDELVECAALLTAVRAGRLDAIVPARLPLDIVAQQIVAEVAAKEWTSDELFGLLRRAAPFRSLGRDDFDDVVELVADGIQTGRGRRGAYLHHDTVNGELRARRGARLAAATSGGAIPETGDYRVVAEPDEMLVGTVNEDFAVESMAGDIFLLGTHSWQIGRVEPGVVRVRDAGDAPPTIPFWMGEAPARTVELSAEVSDLRDKVDKYLVAGHPDEARHSLVAESGIGPDAAAMIVDYLAVGRAALGRMPTQHCLVIERFFDDTGGMQLVVHSPFGGRINRGLGFALRKKFCRSFNFELQAAATDDAVILSLGPHHSFPLDEVARYVNSRTVRETLEQAILDSPMFQARWRWNLNRSLMVLRFRNGKRNPPPIQRMESDDLMAAVFPQAAACQENVTFPIEIPDHVLVRQTVEDTLQEALDIEGLTSLLTRIEASEVEVHSADTTEASVLSHEIVSARPYAFLDDEELQNRRTNAVHLRRGLGVDLSSIGALDPAAIEAVHAEIEPNPVSADDLHDLLSALVRTPAREEWRPLWEELVRRGRGQAIDGGASELWCTTESEPEARQVGDDEAVAADVVRGHLELTGITTATRLAELTQLPPSRVRIALALLEQEGFALQGSYTPHPAENDRDDADPLADPRDDADPLVELRAESDPESETEPEWVARRLLARMHSYSRKARRNAVPSAASAQDFMRFLLRWQHVAPSTQLSGEAGLVSVVEQLQGFEAACVAWEPELLARRLRHYDPGWLDRLCHDGETTWLRLGPRQGPSVASPAAPSKATPVAVVFREDLGWLVEAVRHGTTIEPPAVGVTAELVEVLAARGACFASELAQHTHRLPDDVERGLWDGVARGLLMCDGFGAIRSRVTQTGPNRGRPNQHRRPSATQYRRLSRLGRAAPTTLASAGRWALVPLATAGAPSPMGAPPAGAPPTPGAERPDRGHGFDPDELAETVAEQLLRRWGVVFRDLWAHDSFRLPWREVQWALRRLEDRGLVRGGRFVAGFGGEQFALPEAAEQLTRVTRTPKSGERVSLNATDPLNLVGSILPGQAVPAVRTNTVLYVDGVYVDGVYLDGVCTDGPHAEGVAVDSAELSERP